jgi:hypothetical protein
MYGLEQFYGRGGEARRRGEARGQRRSSRLSQRKRDADGWKGGSGGFDGNDTGGMED